MLSCHGNFSISYMGNFPDTQANFLNSWVSWKFSVIWERNWVFATNSDFLITISLEPNVTDLRYFKLWIMLNQIIRVWNIKGLQHRALKILGFKYLISLQRLNSSNAYRFLGNFPGTQAFKKFPKFLGFWEIPFFVIFDNCCHSLNVSNKFLDKPQLKKKVFWREILNTELILDQG